MSAPAEINLGSASGSATDKYPHGYTRSWSLKALLDNSYVLLETLEYYDENGQQQFQFSVPRRDDWVVLPATSQETLVRAWAKLKREKDIGGDATTFNRVVVRALSKTVSEVDCADGPSKNISERIAPAYPDLTMINWDGNPYGVFYRAVDGFIFHMLVPGKSERSPALILEPELFSDQSAPMRENRAYSFWAAKIARAAHLTSI